MKVSERVVHIRVRRVVTISENQFGLMLGRLTTKVIHLVKRVWSSIGRGRTYTWRMPRRFYGGDWRLDVYLCRTLGHFENMYDGAKTHSERRLGSLSCFDGVALGINP